MTTVSKLVAQHREIETMLAGFETLLAASEPDVASIGPRGWEVCRALLDHFDEEDREICDRLIFTGNAAAIEVTGVFRSDLGTIRDQILHYRADWPVGRVEGEWGAFVEASRAMLARVRERVLREETELYPEAERLIEARPKPIVERKTC